VSSPPAVPALRRVIPNERWELLLEFGDGQWRLFRLAEVYVERGWTALVNPLRAKDLRFDADGVRWAGGEHADVGWLHARSTPLAPAQARWQSIVVGMRNRAPTAQHASHHVYFVSLLPFDEQLLSLGESINGGHFEMGGSRAYAVDELLAVADWRAHFRLADADWAIPFVEREPHDRWALVDALVPELCRRAGATAARYAR
jgi:hypothetical protein